jgi:hypothetical protein
MRTLFDRLLRIGRDRSEAEALLEELQQERELPGGSGSLDAMVGRVLRQVQHLRAIREERRTALTEIEPPGVRVMPLHTTHFCDSRRREPARDPTSHRLG